MTETDSLPAGTCRTCRNLVYRGGGFVLKRIEWPRNLIEGLQGMLFADVDPDAPRNCIHFHYFARGV